MRMLAGVVGQVHRLVGQGEVADEWVVEALDRGAGELDAVGGPADPEVVAAGGQLTDEVRQPPVVGVAAGFGAQDGHRVVAMVSQLVENPASSGSRNMKRTALTGRRAEDSNNGAYSAA